MTTANSGADLQLLAIASSTIHTTDTDFSGNFRSEHDGERVGSRANVRMLTIATGGTITSSGAYTIHTFTTSGTFTPIVSGNVEYLVVAGGGGGSSGATGAGGGGGGGGFRTGTLAVTAQAYTVTVGTGGAIGTKGNDSSFSSITSTGGGKGGKGDGGETAGGNGGSGEVVDYLMVVGQPLEEANSPSTNPVQGYNGGLDYIMRVDANGGGGGHGGGVGSNATIYNGGNGGIGQEVVYLDQILVILVVVAEVDKLLVEQLKMVAVQVQKILMQAQEQQIQEEVVEELVLQEMAVPAVPASSL